MSVNENEGKNVQQKQSKQRKNYANKKQGTRAVNKGRTTTSKGQNRAQQNPNINKNVHKNTQAKKGESLKIIPLGGLEEVGKNITAYEYGNEIILVDCGLAFPSDEMLGIDIVIPDLTYLEQNKNKVKALFVTHGHEDHIGAIPYLLRKINVEIYATRFTMGLIERKLKEHNLLKEAKLHVVKPGATMSSGKFDVEFIRVNHSIPEACSLAVHTPVGVIIQTGDFKVDYTPIDGIPMDLARLGELGRHGVLALLSDSTNSERGGSTKSERVVGSTFEKLFEKAGKKRILLATFASNVHRIQQAITTAEKFGRKLALSGRSMLNVSEIAFDFGYLKANKGTIIELEEANRLPDEQVVIMTTGSQGEPMAALSRMASGTHRQLSVTQHDFIILSSTPVPGNELLVDNLINELMKRGAEVIHNPMYEVHVSGHAYQDEQKLMIELTNPRYFVPVHGEFRHLRRHADTALKMGFKEHRIMLPENGSVMVTDGNNMQMAGRVTAGETMVDGLGVGDVGNIVLRDRKHLSEDGLMIIVATIDRRNKKILSGPDIVSRGFVYVRESEVLLNNAQQEMKKVLEDCLSNNIRDWNTIKARLRDEMRSFVFKETRRRPMVLPILMEV